MQMKQGCYLAHSVQYHTVYVKRCKNHCGASQNIQQAQGRQKYQGAWQYDPGGDFNDDNIDLGGSYNGVDQQHFDLGVSHPYQQQCESCYDVAELVPKQVVSSIKSIFIKINTASYIFIWSIKTIIMIIVVGALFVEIIQVAEKVCHPVARKVHFDNMTLKVVACCKND